MATWRSSLRIVTRHDLLGGSSARRLRVLRVPPSEDAVDGRGSLGVGGVECFTRRDLMRGSDWPLSLGLAVIGWRRSVFLGAHGFGKGDPYIILSIVCFLCQSMERCVMS